MYFLRGKANVSPITALDSADDGVGSTLTSCCVSRKVCEIMSLSRIVSDRILAPVPDICMHVAAVYFSFLLLVRGIHCSPLDIHHRDPLNARNVVNVMLIFIFILLCMLCLKNKYQTSTKELSVKFHCLLFVLSILSVSYGDVLYRSVVFSSTITARSVENCRSK